MFSNRVAVLLCCLAAATVSVRSSPWQARNGSIPLRFHHLHYRVADPGEVLGPAAARLKGSRAIVQGVGVGIRVGREYVLFDRDAGAAIKAVKASTVATPPDAYQQAVRWLTAHAFSVQPPSLAQTSVSAQFPEATFD